MGKSKAKGRIPSVKKKTLKKSQVLKRREYLTLLSQAKNTNRRRKILKLAESPDVKAISECVANFLAGNVRVSPKHHKLLKRYKEPMRVLANRGTPLKNKRHILSNNKSGGAILSLLLPAAISAITGLLSSFGR
jgi:GTP1/Obg family GTP-binding protein